MQVSLLKTIMLQWVRFQVKWAWYHCKLVCWCAQIRDSQCNRKRDFIPHPLSPISIALAVTSVLVAIWMVDNDKSVVMTADMKIALSPYLFRCTTAFFTLQNTVHSWFTHFWKYRWIVTSWLRIKWWTILWFYHLVFITISCTFSPQMVKSGHNAFGHIFETLLQSK